MNRVTEFHVKMHDHASAGLNMSMVFIECFCLPEFDALWIWFDLNMFTQVLNIRILYITCIWEERRCPFRLGWTTGFVFGDVFRQDTEGLWRVFLHSYLNINSFFGPVWFPSGCWRQWQFSFISYDLILVPLFIRKPQLFPDL